MRAAYAKGFILIFEFARKVFPEVDRNLKMWTRICRGGETALAAQALSSISAKRFHAQGGSIFALFPGVDMKPAIRFIVALQTISDYLDNLCDRMDISDESAFRQLHVSMLDAVDPERPIGDYYECYPFKNDNGYLRSLAEACRARIALLPSYRLVVSPIKRYVSLYSELQTYKHLAKGVREGRLSAWAMRHAAAYPGITWPEFSAATGSTLAVFVLFAAAHDPSLDEKHVKALEAAYFPWICALHILLDYYIDAYEDSAMGDLNFTTYYTDRNQCEERLRFFIAQSFRRSSGLPYSGFHKTVIEGLVALYLSDPKASADRIGAGNLLRKGGIAAKLYHSLCLLLRRIRVI